MHLQQGDSTRPAQNSRRGPAAAAEASPTPVQEEITTEHPLDKVPPLPSRHLAALQGFWAPPPSLIVFRVIRLKHGILPPQPPWQLPRRSPLCPPSRLP